MTQRDERKRVLIDQAGVLLGGIFMTSMPASARTASNDAVN